MEVQRSVLPEPPLRYRPGHTAPHIGWQAAVLAAGSAGLFILLLRCLGA